MPSASVEVKKGMARRVLKESRDLQEWVHQNCHDLPPFVVKELNHFIDLKIRAARKVEAEAQAQEDFERDMALTAMGDGFYQG